MASSSFPEEATFGRTGSYSPQEDGDPIRQISYKNIGTIGKNDKAELFSALSVSTSSVGSTKQVEGVQPSGEGGSRQQRSTQDTDSLPTRIFKSMRNTCAQASRKCRRAGSHVQQRSKKCREEDSCFSTPFLVICLLLLIALLIVIAIFGVLYFRSTSSTSPLLDNEVQLDNQTTLLPGSNFNLKTSTQSSTSSASNKSAIVVSSVIPLSIGNCTGFGFRCTNDPSVVVGTNQLCDGNRDCVDGSDELQCKTCQTAFSCVSSQAEFFHCLRGEKLCDGLAQCPNREDEERFCRAKCNSDEYQCKTAGHASPMCIPESFKCDGDMHCKLGDDEVDCDKNQCQNGSKWCAPDRRCISKSNLCDGARDCSDGSDEQDCECRSCSGSDKALCKNSKMCISKSSVCDGLDDCPDGEDEVGCPGYCKLEKPIERVNCTDGKSYPKRYACAGMIPECQNSCSEECDSEMAFRCKSTGMCISKKSICDHVKDCADGSDEDQSMCSCSLNDMYQCKQPFADGTLKCIPMSNRCDGFHDCEGGDDELDCSSCFGNDKAMYCAASKKCIPSASRCNGINDCSDFSDEENCTCHDCKSQMYETYMCATGGRCLKRDDACQPTSECKSGVTNAAEGVGNGGSVVAKLDELFCASRERLFLL